jgi:hypothetical protein
MALKAKVSMRKLMTIVGAEAQDSLTLLLEYDAQSADMCSRCGHNMRGETTCMCSM